MSLSVGTKPSFGIEPDYCCESGAQQLKDMIESYWRDRGRDVLISLHEVGFHPTIRAKRFELRSDMVNGLPMAEGAHAVSA